MSVKWSGGSGGGGASGATADEVVQINNATKNIGLNSLRLAIGDGDAIYEMVDGFGDAYTDETGVNTGSSTGQSYNSGGDYYSGAPASTHSLLIQSGGDTNGSTTIVDSTSTHTPSAVGNVQHSTTQAKFGTSSLKFDGTGDGITVPDSTDFELDTNDWTIDFWIYFTNSPTATNELIVKKGNEASSNLEWRLYKQSTGKLTIQYSTNGTAYGSTIQADSSGISQATWHFCRIVNTSGSGVQFYVDGNDLNASPQSFTAPTGTSVGLTIGDSTSLGDFNGYLEEFSIIKGTARSGAELPVAPYSISASDMTLIGAAQTANSAPTNARMVVLYDPIDASTLNTDCTMELSMDGGSTWSTAFTLSKEADYDSNVEILTSDDLTLDSTSGTSIVYRFKTLNSKVQRIHGVYVQWR